MHLTIFVCFCAVFTQFMQNSSMLIFMKNYIIYANEKYAN